MKPVLVTGAGGLLGQAVVAQLAARRPVYAMLRRHSERHLPDEATVVEHDLRERADPQLPETPETVAHLAQSPRYRDFPEGASDVFEVNVGSTQRLLDWASRNGIKRFILASTGSIYGGGDAAFEEEAPLADEASLGHYVASKRCAELLAESYRDRMVIVVLRFFTIYGPRQRSTMLIPRLIDSVRHGRPITLRGQDGLRINPVYVEDAAKAVEAATRLNSSAIVNVAGPEILSLREIGTLIGKAMDRQPCFEAQPGTPRDLIGSTTRMDRLLEAPQVSFAEGVARMVAAG